MQRDLAVDRCTGDQRSDCHALPGQFLSCLPLKQASQPCAHRSRERSLGGSGLWTGRREGPVSGSDDSQVVFLELSLFVKQSRNNRGIP